MQSLSQTQTYTNLASSQHTVRDTVTQANYFHCCVYWPLTELLNKLVWNTKHDPAQPQLNFYTWNAHTTHTHTFHFDLWSLTAFNFVMCMHVITLNTNSGSLSLLSSRSGHNIITQTFHPKSMHGHGERLEHQQPGLCSVRDKGHRWGIVGERNVELFWEKRRSHWFWQWSKQWCSRTVWPQTTAVLRSFSTVLQCHKLYHLHPATNTPFFPQKISKECVGSRRMKCRCSMD